MKSSAAVALFVALAVGAATGQILQYVEPNPNNGRPLSVKGPDGAWEVPILVISDSDVEIYIPGSSLIASAHMFDKTGKYFVYLYSYYKNDWQCKGLFAGTPAVRLPNFSELCHLLNPA